MFTICNKTARSSGVSLRYFLLFYYIYVKVIVYINCLTWASFDEKTFGFPTYHCSPSKSMMDFIEKFNYKFYTILK